MKGDPVVAVQHQMLHSTAGAVTVVNQHGVRVEEGRWAIDEDDCHSHLAFLDEVAVVVAGRHHDQSVDAPFGEGFDQLAFPNRILVEARRENSDAAS